jgi:UDP-glucose 4-epimerase
MNQSKQGLRILVCGGAGYIGSHMVKLLAERGHIPVIFDNLSTGHRQSVEHGEFVLGDLLDREAVGELFDSHQFDAVMHFSALSLVGDSVAQPLRYYRNNVAGAINLFDAMLYHKVNRCIFSSTAAVYGTPVQAMIDEEHPKLPINPYGRNKLAIEQLLQDLHTAHGLNSLSFRYFNAAGADLSGRLGEAHNPESHLIPLVLESLLHDGAIRIFGNDYDTADGTCVRDYVHVNDLCEAHLLGLDHVSRTPGAHVMNLGNGQGFSVLEVLKAVERVTGREVHYSVVERRPGDPARLVASSALAEQKLGWRPQYAKLEAIIETAWKWHQDKRY